MLDLLGDDEYEEMEAGAPGEEQQLAVGRPQGAQAKDQGTLTQPEHNRSDPHDSTQYAASSQDSPPCKSSSPQDLIGQPSLAELREGMLSGALTPTDVAEGLVELIGVVDLTECHQ